MLKSRVDLMAEKLIQFNTFGHVKVTANEVVVSVAAMTQQGKPIKRVLQQEFEQAIQGFHKDEFLTAIFGAWIFEDGKTQIVFNDMILSETAPAIGDIPEVTKAVSKAVNMILKAVE